MLTITLSANLLSHPVCIQQILRPAAHIYFGNAAWAFWSTPHPLGQTQSASSSSHCWVLVQTLICLLSTSFQLQQFFSDMLEEPQRLTVHAKLQTIKNENLENRQRSARIAAWLRKHT